MYDYFACMHACGPHASEEDFRAPGTGVTDTCEPPCGCWDRTWVLCNSSKCSAIFPQPLPHPIYCFYSWCLVSLYVFWIFAVCSLFPLQFDLGIFSEVGIKAKFFLRKILKASASHLGLPPPTHTHTPLGTKFSKPSISGSIREKPWFVIYKSQGESLLRW